MREWRNWQTRTFEGRVVHTVRVQVPFLAKEERTQQRSFFLLSETDRRTRMRVAGRAVDFRSTIRNTSDLPSL